MKKTRIILASALLVSSFSLIGNSAFAETSNGEVILNSGTTPGGGDIELTDVTDFDFGVHEITGSTQTYRTVNTLTKTTISDLRGNGKGWTLDARISPFTNSDSRELLGAKFSLPVGSLTSDTPTALPPTAFPTILSNSSQTVINAGTDTGMGTWEQDYSDAELSVPGGNYSGSYNAELEWILLSTP